MVGPQGYSFRCEFHIEMDIERVENPSFKLLFQSIFWKLSYLQIIWHAQDIATVTWNGEKMEIY